MFSIKLENDDIQDFDLSWEQALLLTRDPPSGKVLESLYVSKLQDSSQAQNKHDTTQSRNSARRRATRVSQTENVCKLHIEQVQGSENVRIQSEITERVTVIKGKNQNSFTKRKTGECFQWKANGSCSKGEFCSFLHTQASRNRETTEEEVVNARVSDFKPAVNNQQRRKGEEQAYSFVPTGEGQTDVKSSTSLEVSRATGAKILCL